MAGSWSVFVLSYSLVINGNNTSRFCPTRGFRQGDPLSPYLFPFIVDVLSRIQNKVQAKCFAGLKLSRYCLELTHLFFANDSLFFLKANKEHCMRMAAYVQEYCCTLRQRGKIEYCF